MPLPSDEKIRAVVGSTYDLAQALNVVRMMAGTEDVFDALIGLVKAVFGPLVGDSDAMFPPAATEGQEGHYTGPYDRRVVEALAVVLPWKRR